MQFEWDENKRLANIEKHGIDFIRAQRIFDDVHLSADLPYESEPRWVAIGLMDGREIAVIYTMRGKDTIRLISARRARDNERKRFQELYQRATGENGC